MDGVRCRACKREIWRRSESELVSAHGLPLETVSESNVQATVCEDWRHGQVFAEGEPLPPWVSAFVEASGWQSGKLVCECGVHLGSFDFVTGRRCACNLNELPPIRLNTKKIDLFVEPSVSVSMKIQESSL